jgi:hypothetical protein
MAPTTRLSAPEVSQRRSSRQRQVFPWLVAGLIVIAVGLGVLLPFQISAYHRAKSENETTLRAEAVVAANHAAPSYVSHLLKVATGSFKDQLAQIASTLQSTVQQAGVNASATVGEIAVVSTNKKSKTLVLLLTAQQTLKNKSVPKGERRDYRLRVTTTKQRGTWLISDMRFVA